MGNIYRSAAELVGKTPLLELSRLAQSENLRSRVLVKLECFNPAGSAKDRVALAMIEDAEQRGLLKPGATVIEPTSGNTGIGLAAVAAQRGYKAIIVMPDSMSIERRLLMEAYGAQVVLTPGALGMTAAIEKARALALEIPGSYIPGQFENPANAQAHYASTGPEIWEDTDGDVDIFVAGVGTGGTITGVGKYLRSRNPDVQIVAVEPAASPLLSQGISGPHGLQGIGANFIPEVLDRSVIHRVMTATEEQAYRAARLLGAREGLLMGISSGAALHCAMELAKETEGKTIVALLPDTGERYLSSPMFRE